MESQIRQNYHHDCEVAINRMINLEMFASYTYTSMVRSLPRWPFCWSTCFIIMPGPKFHFSPDFSVAYNLNSVKYTFELYLAWLLIASRLV
jgi:hypothetical protein